MKILVTGASGFLGWHLAGRLAADNEVLAAHGANEVRVPGTAGAALDFTDAAACERVVRAFSPTVVFHCGAMSLTGDCERDPDLAERVNVTGTAHLLRAAEMLRSPSHFVQISTDLVFDGSSGNYSEEDPAAPLMVYGRTKLAAEQAVRGYAGPWTIVRSALIYGPPSFRRPCFLQWMLDGIRKGTGALFDDEYRTPVFVGDLIRALLAVSGTRTTGLFHIGGRERLSRYEFGLLVAKAWQLPGENVLRASATQTPTDCPRPRDVSLNVAKARAALNYSPAPAEESLANIATM